MAVVDGAIAVLAGRRTDPEPCDEPRFPFARVATVRDEISAMLASARAGVLVCAAACGADLLALDAARELGIRSRIVLPFSADRFRETSVVDRPHPEFWGKSFDDAIADARKRGDLVELDFAPGDDAAYAATNEAIIEEAKVLARTGGSEAALVAIIVWNGASRGHSDITEKFKQLAENAGFRVEQVRTLES